MGAYDTFVSVLREELKRKGLSVRAAATRAGLPVRSVQGALEGHMPSIERAAKIASALDLEVYIGPRRGQPGAVVEIKTYRVTPERRRQQLRDDATDALNRLQRAVADLSSNDAIPASSDEAETVVVRELRTAAGGGALDLDESISGHVYFKTSWLRKHELNPDQCCIITVTGESMEPTLSDGCAILLDQSRRRRRADSIFVVRGPDGLIVKRARKSDAGEWLLASDNEDWPSAPWPIGAEIVGQVIWTARELV